MLHKPDEKQEQLLGEIAAQIALDNDLSLNRVIKLLFVKRNRQMVRQFWKLLDKEMPGHSFDHFETCDFCDTVHLINSKASPHNGLHH